MFTLELLRGNVWKTVQSFSKKAINTRDIQFLGVFRKLSPGSLVMSVRPPATGSAKITSQISIPRLLWNPKVL
jgi:hypothetical protein